MSPHQLCPKCGHRAMEHDDCNGCLDGWDAKSTDSDGCFCQLKREDIEDEKDFL